MTEPGDLLTAIQVAQLLSTTRQNVYLLARAGKLPCTRLGENGNYRFYRSEIEEWIDRHRNSAVKEPAHDPAAR